MPFRPAQTVGKEPGENSSNEEFLEWVKMNVTQERNNCWNWTGARNKYTGVATYKNSAAHGYIFKRLEGLLGEDTATLGRINRTCKNLKCVNPSHCYIAQGPATRKNIKQEKMLEEASTMLTENQLKHLVNTLTDAIKAQTKVGIEEAVREVVKAETAKTAETVVAELIRIKFDEMIAKGVMDGLRNR